MLTSTSTVAMKHHRCRLNSRCIGQVATQRCLALVKFEIGDAIEDALDLPRYARRAVHLPPHADAPVVKLPDALYPHVHPAEDQPPKNAHEPEQTPVILLALHRVSRVLEDHVIPVDAVCGGTELARLHPSGRHNPFMGLGPINIKAKARTQRQATSITQTAVQNM